jgi:hypothetical protein
VLAMGTVESLLIVLVIVVAASYIGFEVRKKLELVNIKQKHLARLLLVSGIAFSDRNYDLYAASMREIESIFRNEGWGKEQIGRKVRHALKIAKAATSPESFEKVSQLAQAIIQATAIPELEWPPTLRTR